MESYKKALEDLYAAMGNIMWRDREDRVHLRNCQWEHHGKKEMPRATRLCDIVGEAYEAAGKLVGPADTPEVSALKAEIKRLRDELARKEAA